MTGQGGATRYRPVDLTDFDTAAVEAIVAGERRSVAEVGTAVCVEVCRRLAAQDYCTGQIAHRLKSSRRQVLRWRAMGGIRLASALAERNAPVRTDVPNLPTDNPYQRIARPSPSRPKPPKSSAWTTRLPGHSLPLKGRVQLAGRLIGDGNGEGSAACSCGAYSPLLPSSRARRKWHRDHKNDIRSERGLTPLVTAPHTPDGEKQ